MSFKAVADAEGEKEAESVMRRIERMEGAGDPQTAAELAPDSEDLAFGDAGFGNVGCGGDVESKAEVSCEADSLGSWSSCHGLFCG